MGLLDKLLKKEENIQIMETDRGAVYAPLSGKRMPLEQIPDQVFSQGILGPGVGIEPSEEVVAAPVNGVISSIADTKHAIGITSDDGAELLIHVGMDTVEMHGDGFEVKVKPQQRVVCGQTLLTFSLAKIKAANHPATTAFVLTNADEFSDYAYVKSRTRSPEFINRRIRINAIAPSFTSTPLIKDFNMAVSQDGTEASGEQVMYDLFLKSWNGRAGKPEEMGYPLVVIGSQLCSYMSGQIVYIDFGMTGEMDFQAADR